MHPPGWEDDYRAGVIVQTIIGSVGGKAPEMSTFFPSLKTIFKQHAEINKSKRVLPKGKFLNFMEKSAGGDGSGWSLSKLLEQEKEKEKADGEE
jgi:hypothetical protein